jgi:hypothetical protein
MNRKDNIYKSNFLIGASKESDMLQVGTWQSVKGSKIVF